MNIPTSQHPRHMASLALQSLALQSRAFRWSALRVLVAGRSGAPSKQTRAPLSKLLALLYWSLALAASAEAKVLLTVDEALELAFPGCEIHRSTVFLTAAEKARASTSANSEVEQNLVYPYLASCNGTAGGTAYFDTHRVRTLEETIMIVVQSDQIFRIEVLAFREPLNYLPRDSWYAQFVSEVLRAELDLGRNIRPVAGATLTARATTEAVRRVLALHLVIATRDPTTTKEGHP